MVNEGCKVLYLGHCSVVGMVEHLDLGVAGCCVHLLELLEVLAELEELILSENVLEPILR